MQLPEKAIEEFKAIWKKEYDTELSDEDAQKYSYDLMQFTKCLFDMSVTEMKRKDRLKIEPNGFPLDGVGYTCAICKQHTRQNESWYDKYGIKCLKCQNGVNKKQIPASMAKNTEAWYSTYDLESRFNIKAPTVRKWVKAGILKSRAIINDHGGIHVQIFLIKDNKDFLPPKKLTESHCVQEDRDGGQWVHSEPWYRFVDPFEHLKGYKIIDYVTWVESDKKDSCKKQK